MILTLLRSSLCALATRQALVLVNLALRQQLAVLQRQSKRPRLVKADRVFWIILSRIWAGWASTLTLVKPATVIGWHRKGFRLYCLTFRVLYVFVVLSPERRRVVHFNVTRFPTAKWTALQMVQAFPWDTAPRYLLRDRDATYGHDFVRRMDSLGIEEVMIAPRSPWQNPYSERLVGTLRRDCLNHMIVLSEDHLRRIIQDYLGYYHDCRTHLSLDKDAPEPRAIEPPESGEIIALPQVGGLHHRYTRRAA